mmetsp:Transcript_105478/g.251273  ORF Transcript_105478/g.251273 Transcript_105478/m.251273 type:complete len:285 (-) Transcript_105478:277-1131(-)
MIRGRALEAEVVPRAHAPKARVLVQEPRSTSEEGQEVGGEEKILLSENHLFKVLLHEGPFEDLPVVVRDLASVHLGPFLHLRVVVVSRLLLVDLPHVDVDSMGTRHSLDGCSHHREGHRIVQGHVECKERCLWYGQQGFQAVPQICFSVVSQDDNCCAAHVFGKRVGSSRFDRLLIAICLQELTILDVRHFPGGGSSWLCGCPCRAAKGVAALAPAAGDSSTSAAKLRANILRCRQPVRSYYTHQVRKERVGHFLPFTTDCPLFERRRQLTQDLVPTDWTAGKA